jgi:hypothetical protein
VFPTPTNDLQKPLKFVSTSGKVFFGKESEKASEGKPVEELSGDKPSEQPQPKPKPKLVRFHCGYCGRDGHRDEFCFKRKREERMEKEWANKDKYHPSDGALEPCVQMPRAKACVRTVRAWGQRRAVGGAAAQATPARPVWGTGQTGAGLDRQQFGFRARTGARVVSGGRGSGGWAGEFAGGQVSRHSPLEFTTGMGGVVALRSRGGTVHGLSFVVLVLLQVESGGSLRVVTVLVFVEVALVGEMAWFVLITLSSKWLGTGFALLVLTPVLSHLFAHVLVF